MEKKISLIYQNERNTKIVLMDGWRSPWVLILQYIGMSIIRLKVILRLILCPNAGQLGHAIIQIVMNNVIMEKKQKRFIMRYHIGVQKGFMKRG